MSKSSLVDQKLAVSLFLESLMREPREETAKPVPVAEAPVMEPPVISPPVIAPVELTPAPVAETPVEVVVESPIEIKEITPEIDTVTETQPEGETEQAVEAGRPEWAAEPFQAMLFKVAGLGLAVPLVELNGVVEFTEELTEMPGHAPFYMGVMTHLDKSIPVIDTARLVLPAEKLSSLAGDDPLQRVTRVVLIDNYRWGLACDEVNEVITLEPDQVRWRSSRTKRTWLAGTVVDHMCALIDAPAFSRMLVDGSHQRR